MQEELEALLNQRWITKRQNKKLYYQIRDQLGEIRKFTTEKMGCSILENSLLVKMDKIPVQPQSFMGIREFASREEYAFFCVLLMFLEDKDPGEQFILSQLTEYVKTHMPGAAPDWTSYTQRRRLIRVLRYADKQEILAVTDGSDEVFMNGGEGEVLYENTGISRYFMRNFTVDIMHYTRPEQFFQSQWQEMGEDRGIARRHRVYNRLLFSPGVYKSEGIPEDFEYLKNYGRRMENELEEKLGCRLDIHKGSAYLIEGEDSRLGETLPGHTVASDCLLVISRLIREKVGQGNLQLREDETILVDQLAFEGLLREAREQCLPSLTKNYRDMTEGEWFRAMEENMEQWTMLQKIPEQRQILLMPILGKIEGRYPDSGEALEQTNRRKRRKRRKA